ncbi:MAG TPA: metallophosphoesterase family protein [Spirochaetota bacterium]|nr:metallophosphoesterase family protein [Spirochaetota bacterium]
MIKILLTADLHWGTTRDGLSSLHACRAKTFERIMSLAATHDLLLVAGDLFDGLGTDDPAYRAAAERFGAVLSGGTAIALVPGETECGDDGAPLPVIDTLPASRVFSLTDEGPLRLERGGEVVHVYGAPARMPFDPARYARTNDDGFHIGLFHGNFTVKEDGDGAPVHTLTRELIRECNLDFFAVGHTHGFRIFKQQNRVIGASPGSPEAAARTETGERSVLSIALENNEITSIRRVIVNTAELRALELDCGACASDDALFDELAKNKSPVVHCTARLVGRREFFIDPARLDQLRREFLSLDITDESAPGLGALLGEFSRENSLRGEFFSLLDDMRRRSALPADVDETHLRSVLESLGRTGTYRGEDWR